MGCKWMEERLQVSPMPQWNARVGEVSALLWIRDVELENLMLRWLLAGRTYTGFQFHVFHLESLFCALNWSQVLQLWLLFQRYTMAFVILRGIPRDLLAKSHGILSDRRAESHRPLNKPSFLPLLPPFNAQIPRSFYASKLLNSDKNCGKLWPLCLGCFQSPQLSLHRVPPGWGLEDQQLSHHD